MRLRWIHSWWIQQIKGRLDSLEKWTANASPTQFTGSSWSGCIVKRWLWPRDWTRGYIVLMLNIIICMCIVCIAKNEIYAMYKLKHIFQILFSCWRTAVDIVHTQFTIASRTVRSRALIFQLIYIYSTIARESIEYHTSNDHRNELMHRRYLISSNWPISSTELLKN